MSEKQTFGEYLGALLREKDISINELSHRMHGDAGHISRVIRGERANPASPLLLSQPQPRRRPAEPR